MKRIIDSFKNPTELIFLSVLFVIALYFFIRSFGFKEGAWEFPMFTSAATLIFIFSYVIKMMKIAPKNTEKKEITAEERLENKVEFKKVVITIASFIGYIIVSYLFGFLIAASVVAVVFPLIYGYRKPLGAITCLVVNIAIVLAFQSALGVNLSRGTLLDLSYLFF